MTNVNEVARELNQRLGETYEGYKDIIPAVIKSVDGSVHPTNQPHMVWVAEHGLDGSRVKVLNILTDVTDGTPVWVGPNPKQPDTRMVIGLYDGDLTPNQSASLSTHNSPRHAQNHQYPSESDPGVDPVLVFQPAIQPLKVVGDGSTLSVTIGAGKYMYDGTPGFYVGESYDTTSLVPSTASRTKRVLLYLDPSVNTVGALSGTEVITGGAIDPDYPVVPRGMIPLAYIQLTNGQTSITTATHIEDWRFLFWARADVNPFGPFRWVWADSAERSAETDVSQDDVDNQRMGIQLDDGTIWRATATTPTFSQLAGTTIGAEITEITNGFSIISGTTNEQQVFFQSDYGGSDYKWDFDTYNSSAKTQIRAGASYSNDFQFYGSVDISEVTITGNGNSLDIDGNSSIDQGVKQSDVPKFAGLDLENQAGNPTLHGLYFNSFSNNTTDATATQLYLTPGTTTKFTIPSNSIYSFDIHVVARRSDADNESALYGFRGAIDNNGGTVALVGAVDDYMVIEDTAAWSVSVTANNTDKSLDIEVTGENSKNIDWFAGIIWRRIHE